MGREVKSGRCKISVPLDEALRSNYKKVCEEVLKTSMNDHLRNHIQATVKKFKKMVPDEPNDLTGPITYIKVDEKKNPT